jgi:hypothetical protein
VFVSCKSLGPTDGPVVLATLDLPAGSYSLSGYVTVLYGGAIGLAQASCTLTAGGDSDSGGLSSNQLPRTSASPDVIDDFAGQIDVNELHSFTSQGSVSITCSADTETVGINRARLTAV